MNLLKTFESRVSDAFGAAPQGYTEPISFKKLAKRTVREMESETYEIDGIDTAPALFTILVAPADDSAMRPLYDQLTNEIVAFAEAQAQSRGYVFVGQPLARFMVDPSLKSGKFAVFAENVDAQTLEQLRAEEERFLAGSAGLGGAAAGVGQENKDPREDERVRHIRPVSSRHQAQGVRKMPIVNQPEPATPVSAAPAPIPVADVTPTAGEGASEFAPDISGVPADNSAGLGVIPQEVVDDALAGEIAQPDFGNDYRSAGASQYQPPTGYEDSIMMAPTPAPTPAPVSIPAPSAYNVPATQRRNVPLVNPRHATPVAQGQPIDVPTCLLIDHQTGRTYTGNAPSTVIGRERTPHGIILRDPNVSRHHAELTFDGRNWTITDLGSTNGTMVNNIDVDSCVLRDGDLITVGLMNLEFRRNA
ncbi:MAG: DUF3662 and FHA domain-containing protein [Olsenella sp.]|nr:DUF3662 and FHA domain-containing protein [Olsenella sp.]